MAFINHTSNSTIDGEIVIVWANVKDGDECERYRIPKPATQVVIQGVGDFSAGGKVDIAGSNNDIDYADLLDVNGMAARLNMPGLLEITVLPIYIKPVVTGASADITINIVTRFTI